MYLFSSIPNFFLLLYPAGFGTGGRRGRFGKIQTFTVPQNTRYLIKAWGARGGTHSYDYGDNPGTYYGGKGAFKEGKFTLNKGTVLNIVVEKKDEIQWRSKVDKAPSRLQLNLENL